MRRNNRELENEDISAEEERARECVSTNENSGLYECQ